MCYKTQKKKKKSISLFVAPSSSKYSVVLVVYIIFCKTPFTGNCACRTRDTKSGPPFVAGSRDCHDNTIDEVLLST